MTQRNIFIVMLVFLLLGVGSVHYIRQENKEIQNTSSEEAVNKENVAMGTTSEKESEDQTLSNTQAQSIDVTSSGSGATTPKNTNSNTVEVVTKIDLGPRKKSETAGDPIRYFAEAMQAEDIERALSYFRADVREQYRIAFTEYTSLKNMPVVNAYFTGTVSDAELIEPRYGWYRVSIYPQGSKLGFHTQVEYDTEAREFLITEL